MKEKVKEAFSLYHDTADYAEIKDRIISGGKVTGTNLCILMMAILIASVGLNMNSTAVIIGAMLISPLMGSIQAMGYGVATGDIVQIKKSGIGFLFQIVISLITSTLYFCLSPISTQTSELLARTQPNIWDVMIATCGGIAGMIGATRKEKSNVIPGVAIATALMPPLCTCGYGIAHGSLRIALGAGYLFLVNTYFIFLSSVLILIVLKVPQEGEFSQKQKKRMNRRLILNTVIILIPCLVVAGFMVRQANVDSKSVTGFEATVSVQKITQEIKILFPSVDDVKVGTLESVDKDGNLISETNVIVYLQEEPDQQETNRMQRWLDEVYDGACKVIYITDTQE
ncbi:MAG: DUF389 domain-containing protein [Acutalibacteraceae bacterium]